MAASSEATGEDMYRYAELLRTSGQYADSDIWLKRFGKLAPDDSRARLKENSVEQVAAIMEKEGISHKVDPVNINGAYSEISPFIKDRTLYFASNRPEKLSVKHVHTCALPIWTGGSCTSPATTLTQAEASPARTV